MANMPQKQLDIILDCTKPYLNINILQDICTYVETTLHVDNPKLLYYSNMAVSHALLKFKTSAIANCWGQTRERISLSCRRWLLEYFQIMFVERFNSLCDKGNDLRSCDLSRAEYIDLLSHFYI